MKKFLAVVILLSFFCVSSFAVVNIGVSGGYASVSMNEVNSNLDARYSYLKGLGLNPSLTKLGSGLYGNLDLNFGVIPFLNFGLRTGILYCFQGKWTMDGNLNTLISIFGTTFPSINASVSETFDTLLIPVMAGLGLNMGLPGMPFSVNTGIYAGYGFSIVSLGGNIKLDSPSLNLPFNPVYNGGGFVMDAGIGFGFSILPFISATLNVAYKMAKIAKVKATSDVALGAPINITIVKKDDVLKDKDGKAMPIDYSGINVGLGINIGF